MTEVSWSDVFFHGNLCDEIRRKNLEKEEKLIMYVKRAIYGFAIKLTSIVACTT